MTALYLLTVIDTLMQQLVSQFGRVFSAVIFHKDFTHKNGGSFSPFFTH
ncbi:hypothetical protein [Rodentibacter mrazii]|nr:hypothetical protein [Rodentibacter mrazii]